MRIFFSQRQEIPYLYLSLYFILLFSQATLHVFSDGDPSFVSHFFFLLFSSAQALLEVFALFLFQIFCEKYCPKALRFIFMGFLFFLFLFHIVNFVVLKLLDVTIIYVFQLFFTESLEHYFSTIRAINLHSFTAILAITAVLSIPFVGCGLYLLCQKFSKKRPLFLARSSIGLILAGSCCLLLLLESWGWSFIENKEKKFPWTISCLIHEKKETSAALTIREPKEESILSKSLEKKKGHIAKRPNIYLFVVESFRKDSIQKDIAPHLHQFSQENISFSHSMANATASHVSWFSIFHSTFPYHWNTCRQTRTTGSFPLQILKKMGYTIHLSSSAELNYFTMDQLIFGKERQIADHYQEMKASLPAWQRDQLSMQGIDYSKKEGNLFIVFLDATHSEYSYPKENEVFTPTVDFINYLGLCSSKKDLPLIKNRYYNAVHYIDSLLGTFFHKLQENDLWDNSIIAITGDHGEEFFEEGSLFHGSHLNVYQTHIPIFYKFPHKVTPNTSITSQMDIFPSIIDYLSPEESFSEFFDGESIFHKTWPYVISAKQKGSYTPTDLLLQGEECKISVKLEDSSSKKKFHLLSIQGKHPRLKTEPSIFSVFKKAVLPEPEAPVR